MVDPDRPASAAWPRRLVFVLALVLVLVGMVNSTPSIPGWDSFWRDILNAAAQAVRRV
jgi:hypothetical protein